MTARVLGIDTGFSEFGWAVAEISRETETIVDAGLIRTKKDKRKILATVDNIRRSRIIAVELDALVEKWDPVAFAVESMSWPRNASVTGKIGLAWGVVIAVAALRGIPIIPSSPQAIKKNLTGSISASKAVVLECVLIHPGFEELERILEEIPKSRREHPVDAAAAVITALDTEIMRAIRAAGRTR